MVVIGDKGFSKYFKEVFVINPNENLACPVASHVDMNLCVIDSTVFLPKGSMLEKIFVDYGYEVKFISEDLGENYPFDARLNCKSVGNTVILNRKTVSKDILCFCENRGKRIINVNQGYAACSTVALNEDAYITSDKGIYNQLVNNGLNPLLIKEGYIEIEEYDYGFIGGASGFVGDTLYFFGDISTHPDYEKIKTYLDKNNVSFKYFDCPLYDIGGVFDLKKIKKDV